MDRLKPPGPWSDGVREPREALSKEPNRELWAKPEKAPLDVKTLDHRAANQAFDTSTDGPPSSPVEQYKTQGPTKHPRVTYRAVEPQPDEHSPEPSKP